MIRKLLVLACVLASSSSTIAQDVKSPPVDVIMFLDNAPTTSDKTVSLLYKRLDQPYQGPTQGLVAKNDADTATGAGILVTFQGTTTATTPTSGTTQTSVLIRPGESVPLSGQYKTLHYRKDGAGNAGFRVIMVY